MVGSSVCAKTAVALYAHQVPCCCPNLQVLLDSITGSSGTQQQQGSSSGAASVLQHLPKWLSSTRQDLERALARVAAGTAAPVEAVGLWSRLAQVCM